MPAALDHVADGVALPVARGHDEAAGEGQVDLPAMGVRRHQQGEAIGEEREEVGVVGEAQGGGASGDGGEGAVGPRMAAPLVADADQPE